MSAAVRKPDTFIIGAAKSGTTSLYGYLREHPQVFMSREKEPEFFAPDVAHMRRGRPFVYPQDVARYLDLFARARNELRVGEASATYLMSREAPRLIKSFQPDARLIVMLRNPVDLLYSMYGHRVAHGSEWMEDFASALALDDDRRNGRQLQLGRAGLGAAYRDFGNLGDQLERWLAIFERVQIHIVVFDDFVADTPAEFARALRFLGVDDSFQLPTFEVHNASHRRRGGPVGAVGNSPMVRWLSRTALPGLIGERATARVARRFSRRRMARESVERPPIDSAVRAALEHEFAGDVQRLGRLIGRDLTSEWFGDERDASAA